MAALTTLSWDLLAPAGGPRRPSLDDVGSALLADHATRPPDKSTMPYADQLNQWARQIEAFGKIIGFVGFSVEFIAGAPTVVAFTCPSTLVSLSTFIETDNGAGDTTITWPANTFPPPLLRPFAFVNGASSVRIGISADPVSNGVRVYTRAAADALTDQAFSVLYI